MYAQLGNIKFEGLRGFTGLKRDREAVFAELALLDGKARLQRIGSALQAISFDMLLRREFTDPVADILQLDETREAGEILPLLTGDGAFLGNFVIVKMSEQITETTVAGVPSAISVTIDLKEFVDPNPGATQQQKAQSAGFANNPAKVVPVKLERGSISQMAVTSQASKSAAIDSDAAIKNIHVAAVDPTQKISRLAKAAQFLKDAQAKAQDAIKAAQNVQNLTFIAPNLETAIQAVFDSAGILKNYVLAGDLTNALTQSDALAVLLGSLDTAILPLNSVLMKRG